MNNLGGYQKIVVMAKKVGGPLNFVMLLIGGGAALGILGTQAIETIKKQCKKTHRKSETIFEVTLEGKTECELELNVGDKYKVLESDGEAILIEKIGDTNNPYIVSSDFLQKISNFKK